MVRGETGMTVIFVTPVLLITVAIATSAPQEILRHDFLCVNSSDTGSWLLELMAGGVRSPVLSSGQPPTIGVASSPSHGRTNTT